MKNLSKGLYITLFVATYLLIFFIFFTIGYIGASSPYTEGSIYGGNASNDAGIILIIVGVIILIGHFIVLLHLTYKMWLSIQDTYARMTPGKAIGLLFIPFYGIYWMYQVLVGFADDYNNFIGRNQIATPELNRGTFIAYYIFYIVGSILSFLPVIAVLFIIVYMIFGSIIISKVCDAVNAVNSGLSKRVEGMNLSSNFKLSPQS